MRIKRRRCQYSELVRLALHERADRRRSLEELERIAIRQDGPFASPLRFLTDLVRNDGPLRTALRSILSSKTRDVCQTVVSELSVDAMVSDLVAILATAAADSLYSARLGLTQIAVGCASA